MNSTLRSITPLIGVAVLAANANAVIVIDYFTQGASDLQINGGLGVLESQQLALSSNVAGGQRDVRFAINENPFNRTGRFEIDPNQGATFQSTGPGVRSTVQLDYDSLDDESTNPNVLTPSSAGLNLNLANENRFVLNFLLAEPGISVRMDLFTFGAQEARSTATLNLPEILDGQAVDLFFSSFTPVFAGGASFNDVDRILITFNSSNPSSDFALGNVRAVPEPASMAALGLGLVGLISRRRKNR